MNRERVRDYLNRFDFRTLFIEEMGWSGIPNAKPAPITVQEEEYRRRAIAQLSGVTVFEISPVKSDFPDAKTRKAIHSEISKTAYENLLIFVDAEAPEKRTRSLWYWVKREGKKELPREHLYMRGQPGDLFLSKLDNMVVELDDLRADGTLPITEVTKRLASSLDMERVTRRFYTEFSSLRGEFIDLITGIMNEADRGWYASVLLNRLMFVYFLQKKGFIDRGNTDYLGDKLLESQGRGADRFYSEFLKLLFFEGFAKPFEQHSPDAQRLLGDIRYLNGGLFLPHPLEIKYPDIQIPDVAFDNLLKLFGRYSWHLDDTPGAADNEINPDVLGYIFEKYINQKAFGAYYTRTEITDYLCERTINAVILDKINATSGRQFSHIHELLVKLDADLCRRLLDEDNGILAQLSILDPACGSGAFLVAAMKTLLNIYAALFGKIKFLTDKYLTEKLAAIEREHPSVNYYIRKRIITDNLYGVDIMEEATEIAKLRLFLTLVASAQSVDHLEPLPNVDFNIMAGNSLIGLLNVDGTRFEGKGQLDLFQGEKAARYQQQLAEKNRLINLYRRASSLTSDLQSIRDKIDVQKKQAYAVLNEILLEDFQQLGIKYEQAQANGKAKKRPLVQADIDVLQPFHWGYEFDEIMGRGGFDVIIANPPWEVFQTDEKEFFQRYDQLIHKKKIDIKTWEKQRDKLLQDPEIEQAWLDYCSGYPHVSAYFKNAPQFINQQAEMGGKSVARKINLYMLFTEHCFRLLRQGGQCGIVTPSGIYADLGSKQLREMLFTETRVTGLFGFENRKTIFEGVDSRFKFAVLTFEKGGRTESFPAAFMRHEVSELERFPNNSNLQFDVALIRKLSPDSLSIMEFNDADDVQIIRKTSQYPLLGEDIINKWKITFRQELNMTSDSHLFHKEPAFGRLPLYEGKMIHQFTHKWEGANTRYWIEEQEARKAVLGRRISDKGQTADYQTYRLGFREVARNTDVRTMIAAILPKNVFAGHTLLVSSAAPHDAKDLLAITALFNSFPVDWVLRQKVNAHVSMFYLYQTPVPRLSEGDPFFVEIVERAAKLICTTPEFDDLAKEVGLGSHLAGVTDAAGRAQLRAELDGMIAHLYGLSEAEFCHILATFPLVAEEVKDAAVAAYRRVE